MMEELKQFLDELKGLRKALKAESSDRVAKKALRDDANELGTRWHKSVSPELKKVMSKDILDRYDVPGRPHHSRRTGPFIGCTSKCI
jgi:hypothetical protein